MPKRVEHITENGVKRSGVQGANNIDLWKSFIRLLGIHGTISFTCVLTVSRRRETQSKAQRLNSMERAKQKGCRR